MSSCPARSVFADEAVHSMGIHQSATMRNALIEPELQANSNLLLFYYYYFVNFMLWSRDYPGYPTIVFQARFKYFLIVSNSIADIVM